MKAKFLFLIFGAGLAVAVVFLASHKTPGSTISEDATDAAKAEWLTDFKTAQQRALAENKTLLIDFTGSDWCPPCMLLEKQVFSQSEFTDYATRNLILLKVDFPRRKSLPANQQAANNALADRFAIQGYPTILAMGADGKLKGQVSTSMFESSAKFIADLERIVRKS